MPTLCGLVGAGASCFNARTVVPSITLPAHASLLRGVDPTVHKIVDNTPKPLRDDWPTFLRAARSHGLRTAAAVNWSQVAGLLERDAVDALYFLDGGYDPADDGLIRRAATSIIETERPDVTFVYFVAPDLAGHDHGWGSEPYLDALRASDAHLEDLLECTDHAAILVTTDHGGHGNDHQLSEPIDQITFMTLRAAGVAPATSWASASILDVAPTVAALGGFEASPAWSGTSLLGNERPTVDVLLDEVRSLEAHSYGENVSMLSHALQTAAQARASGGTNELVLAGLLHDVGHLSERAGAWGDPDHAESGALRLQQLLPPAVVEPVRLHVAAKRWLVANDSTYLDQLSEASKVTLGQQGGPFDDIESAAFSDSMWAADGVALRRCDDHAKDPTSVVPGVDAYRDLLHNALINEPESAAATRDRCHCPTCRDSVSGQSLLDVGGLRHWRVQGTAGHNTLVRNIHTDEVHTIVEPTDAPSKLTRRLWTSLDSAEILTRIHAGDVAQLARAVATGGLAVAHGLSTEPGSVLDFAATLGNVRTTNYGALFDVRNKPAANNLAYTSKQLPLHTDNPYRDPVPTVQVLHCLLSAAPQGASFFCDGFSAAEQLRRVDPQAFAILTSTLLTFRFADETVALQAEHPMIELDVAGSVRAVHVNHRSMVTPTLGRRADGFYAAYAAFQALCTADSNMVETVLHAGDVAIFDNRRVLHARGSFDATRARHLQGCYIDIDAVESIVRKHDANP